MAVAPDQVSVIVTPQTVVAVTATVTPPEPILVTATVNQNLGPAGRNGLSRLRVRLAGVIDGSNQEYPTPTPMSLSPHPPVAMINGIPVRGATFPDPNTVRYPAPPLKSWWLLEVDYLEQEQE